MNKKILVISLVVLILVIVLAAVIYFFSLPHTRVVAPNNTVKNVVTQKKTVFIAPPSPDQALAQIQKDYPDVINGHEKALLYPCIISYRGYRTGPGLSLPGIWKRLLAA